MPCVTVCPTPKGLPMARTMSPTWRASESPKSTNWRFDAFLSRSTARSVRGSRSTMSASNSRRSASATFTSFMFSITWLLVITSPAGSTITPEPRELWERPGGTPGLLPSPKKRRKNSSMAAFCRRSERVA